MFNVAKRLELNSHGAQFMNTKTRKTLNKLSDSTVNAKEFSNALMTLKAGLGSKELIPILGHYCFEDTSITTFNNVLCITIELKTGINGGLVADKLLNWTKSLPPTSTITIKSDSTKAEFKAGKSSLTLPLVNPEDFIHEDKSFDDDKKSLTDELLTGLEVCLRGVSKDDQLMGAVFVDGENLFSTDGMSITNYSLESPFDIKLAVPADFCKVLLDVANGQDFSVVLKDNIIAAQKNDSSIKLWSKIPTTVIDNNLNFLDEIDKAINSIEEYIPIPEGLSAAIDRFVNVCSGDEIARTAVQLKVADDNLSLSLNGNINLEDSIKVLGLPETDVKIDVAAVQAALTFGTDMGISQNVLSVVKFNENGPQTIRLQSHLS